MTNPRLEIDYVIRGDAGRMAAISKALRNDREIAFYGTEDLIPSEFYTEADAARAFADVEWVHARVTSVVPVTDR